MSDSRYDYLEYIASIKDPEVREYLRKFYKEYYFGEFRKTDNPIITDKEIIKEADKNNNAYKTDPFVKGGALQEISYLPEDYDQFMQDACDEWDWERELKMHGFEAALEMITNQAIRDLNNNMVDKKIVLLRYYEQRDRLRRLENREKREKKENKNEE